MKILILTASAGNGHNSAAQKIRDKILQEHNDYQIEIVDIYKTFDGKLKSWAMSNGYLLLCNHFVGIHNYFYKKSERSDFENQHKSRSHKSTYSFLTGLLNKIYSYKPDLIISTYIFATVGLYNLKKHYNIPAQIFSMTLDYAISPCWECANCVDKMFLTHEDMIQPFIKRGYNQQQLVVSGIPVSEKFNINMDKNLAQKQLGLRHDLPTILVMKSGFFGISNKDLINEFQKVKTPLQIIFINGKNQKEKNRLDKKIHHLKSIHCYVNIGFSEKIDVYMSASDFVLTKAGGLTTTECLSKNCVMLIVSKLPQQEIENKKFFVDKNCALDIEKPKKLSATINDILSSKIDLQQFKDKMKSIPRYDTLKIIMNEIKKVPMANYPENTLSNFKKKDVLKNIRG